MCFKSNCTGSKIQVIFFLFFASAEPSKYNCVNLDSSFLPRGDNSKRQTLKVQQQAVSGVFEGREIKTGVFVEQRRVVFSCLPSGCCLHFLLKNLQRQEGERDREKWRIALKRVQKTVTGIRNVGSVLYVCVHLCTSGVWGFLIDWCEWDGKHWAGRDQC